MSKKFDKAKFVDDNMERIIIEVEKGMTGKSALEMYEHTIASVDGESIFIYSVEGVEIPISIEGDTEKLVENAIRLSVVQAYALNIFYEIYPGFMEFFSMMDYAVEEVPHRMVDLMIRRSTFDLLALNNSVGSEEDVVPWVDYLKLNENMSIGAQFYAQAQSED